MKRIDPKYSIKVTAGGPKILNLAGVPIPDDEPLFLLRAKDKMALRALLYYRTICAYGACSKYHIDALDDCVKAFKAFIIAHPDRLKKPDTPEGK